MKTNRRIMLLILFIAGTGIFTLQAQNREERKELKEQTVKEKIESENYRIDINTAYPRRGRMIPQPAMKTVAITCMMAVPSMLMVMPRCISDRTSCRRRFYFKN